MALRSFALQIYLPKIGCGFHTSPVSSHIIKLTRLRVVDNSEIGKLAMAEGKPPKCDKVLVAIRGQKKKGILVGVKQNQEALIPKFDSNNVVLVDDNGTPLGTRIHVPIPHSLRTQLKEKNVVKGADFTKLLGIATRFV
ncbi:39S ribosomal protein L14 [Blattella germanica]|nr:39S ribosomal protein L14 [Blattella germanica]